MAFGRSSSVRLQFLALSCVSTSAQQVMVSQVASATITIDGKQLRPHPKFGGVIRERASESQPWWSPRVVPPKGAPNVLLIMTDDDGLGAEHSAASFRHRRWIASRTGTAVHELPLHLTLFADRAALIPGATPRGRLRCGGRNCDGIPSYDFLSFWGRTEHRHHPEGERYATLVVRRIITAFYQATQAGPSTNGRSDGLRVLLWLWSAAMPASGSRNLYRNTTAIYPFQGNPGITS